MNFMQRMTTLAALKETKVWIEQRKLLMSLTSTQFSHEGKWITSDEYHDNRLKETIQEYNKLKFWFMRKLK